MSSLEKYDLLIFDFDGVILDSNQLKLEAFYQAVLKYGEENAGHFKNYVKLNFGTSRFRLFDYFFTNILGHTSDFEIEKEALLKMYATSCIDLYNQASFCDGILDVLHACAHKTKFVASGSLEEELIQVCINKNIFNQFKGIFGSPALKTAIVENIIKTNSFSSAVFIGDALADYEAASINNIPFIGVTKYSTNQPGLKEIAHIQNVTIINTLNDLKL